MKNFSLCFGITLLAGRAMAQCDVDLTTTIFDCQLTNYCAGASTASPVSGTPPFSFLWSNGDTGTIADSLCRDSTYVVTMTDGTGCTATDTVTMTIPVSQFLSHTITNTSCPTCCDGTDTVIATLSNPDCQPLLYMWSPNNEFSPTTPNFRTNLCAGTYTVSIVTSCYCGGIAWTSGPPYCGSSYVSSTIGTGNPTGMNTHENSEVQVSQYGNRVIISSGTEIDLAEVFDLQGRLLFAKGNPGRNLELDMGDYASSAIMISVTAGGKRSARVLVRE